MALNTTPAQSSGIRGAIMGALQIFSNLNKTEGSTENSPQPIDEYESSMTEDEIVSLVSQWRKSYNSYYKEGIEASQTLSFKYWIGKHGNDEVDGLDGGDQLFVDNKIFEAIETFIPIATRANPDPMVQADPGELGQRLSKDIKNVLVHEADRQKLRKILKGMIRHWLIYRVGVIKVGYDPIVNQITTETINPKRMLFDKDGYWDESGLFVGEYIAEKKQATADKLVELFPSKEKIIKEKAQDKMGTKMEYTEWWYRNRDVFYTMEDEVLGKFKNPHWNYDAEAQEPQIDEMGQEIAPATEFVEGKNHFKSPKTPYIGLSIFSTGLQPHDETSLILQNVGIQDLVNRRWRQIDYNVDGMNNGMLVDATFTDEQAAQAASALRRGKAIRVPVKDGNVTGHVSRFPAPGLPADVFRNLQDARQELQGIFGTSGSTPQGIQAEKQVRGKILTNQLDTSRIGGGVTEYLEQAADTAYNWWTQIMFVHFTEVQYYIDAGQEGGAELIQIKNTDLGLLKTLNITVKEGSLIPKDPMTQRNEAIDLWSANAIDPINFYKRLDFSDPTQSAKMLLTWQMVQKGTLPPQSYIPDFEMPMAPGMPPGAPPQMNAPDLPQPDEGTNEVSPIGAKPAAAPESESNQLLDSVPIPNV